MQAGDDDATGGGGRPLATLPCPFCGKRPTVNKVRVGNCQLHGEKMYDYVASCSGHATFSHPRSREDVIALWNTRATPPAEPAAPGPSVEAMAAEVVRLWRSGQIPGLNLEQALKGLETSLARAARTTEPSP